MQLRVNLESLNFFFIKNQLIVFVSILVAVFLLYLPGINAYFVNDDYNWISPTSFNEILKTFWGGWGHGALYRPLTRLLLYVENLIFNENPTGYHVISMMLHSLVLFLFYKVTYKYFSDNRQALVCLFFSLFFYPNHEVVSWISTQTVLLGAFFSVLAIYNYLIFFELKIAFRLYLSLLFYICALMSYESAVITPLIIATLLFLKVKEPIKGIKAIIGFISPFFIVIVLFLIFRNFVLQGLPQANKLNLNGIQMSLNYLRLINNQLYINNWMFAAVIVAIITALVLKLNYKVFLAGLLWFIIGYMPFIVIEGYTGRFAYYSMFGIFIILGYSFSQILVRFRKFSLVIILLLLIYAGKNAYEINKNSYYWYEAGEIARTIPIQLKELSSSFPENSILIFYDIPLNYHQSGVFLTYFEDVIQKKYDQKIEVIHLSHPFNANFKDSLYQNSDNVYKFRYSLDERRLKPIK